MRIREEYREEVIINKSRFIACVQCCRTEEQARFYIEQIRKEYSDATHVCTAYQCGENQMIRRSSDNHEPSGTAGVPILEAIRNSELDDVCVCVVRYFGGIKLGAGGLVRAYGGTASEALKEAPKSIDVLYKQYSVTYPYDLSGTLETWLRKNTDVKDFLYDEQVTCLFETNLPHVEEMIRDLSKGISKPELIKEVVRQAPYNEE